MAYQNAEIRKFLGLYLQANSLTVPDGALEKAMNVIIQDDDVVQKIKGFYEYFDPTVLTANALFLYQSKLMAAFADRLSYFTNTGTAPNETGTKTDLSGSAFAVTAPRVSRSVQQSGNLYTTTDNGVMKIDAYNGVIYKAGAPPGLDLRGVFDRANGVFNGNAQVAYRIVFGRKDLNDNLLLGAPSDILVLTNAKVLTATYTSIIIGAGPTYTVTVTRPNHLLAVGMAVVITRSTDLTDLPVGTYTVVSVPTANTYTVVAPGDPGTGDLDYTATRKPRIEFSVPRELTDVTQKWFYQVYRTTISSSDLVDPEVDFRKIDEQYLTAGQLSAGLVFYTDTINQVLVTYAPELYTNPNSGEGEQQANTRPPKCDDTTLFQGCVFYAKCTTRHFLNLDVVAPAALTTGDKVDIKVDALTRTYTARTGVGNADVTSESASNVGTTITVNYTTHGLLAGDTIYVSNALGTGTLPSGTQTVATVGANSFTFTAAIAPTTLTSLDFEGVTNLAGERLFELVNTGDSVSAQLSGTAKGLVKAVNRDPSAVIYGNYTSGITDTPGKMRFTAQGFGGAIYFRATAGGAAFSPVLPASFAAGDQVFSRNENQRNAIFVSKFQEPEAAPAANTIFVGSRNSAILRSIALRNSVIVLKEDGVFKVTGDNPRNFTATLLDNTVICISANSAAAANNTVYFLASEGGSAATDSAVEIITRKIENVIEPIAGKAAISAETAGIGYDSNRTYRLSTIGPNDQTKTVTWLYNFLNDTWTESDYLFKGGVVGPSDTLFIIDGTGKILRERKSQTKLDFSGQNYAVTVVSVDANRLAAVISMTTAPVAGDVIVKANVINRIDTVTASGSDYIITFVAQCNLVAADSTILYKAFISRMDFAPFHGGSIGQEKQFAQLQVHTRDNGIAKMTITFQNTYFGGSESTEWSRYLVQSTGGWGEFPFGFEGWGQEEGIETPVATLPAPPIRIYIPQFAQRATFLKTMLEHSQACDPINIQALALSVRSYAERVSK